jgi:hypothetical protein
MWSISHTNAVFKRKEFACTPGKNSIPQSCLARFSSKHDIQNYTFAHWQRGNNVYSATLNKTDIEQGKNSYYILQVPNK